MGGMIVERGSNHAHLQTLRLGGRVKIHQDSLLNYLDHLRINTSPSVDNSANARAGAARREFVLAGPPPEKIERARALTEKIEASRPLTLDEEAELARLQDELARVSWERLKKWMGRSGPSA